LIDDNGKLYPVPVRILNLAGNKNRASPDEFTGNSLTRRFFLIDNVSGVSNNTLKVIRFPSQISLWYFFFISFNIRELIYCIFRVRKVDQATGTIYTPFLDILYAERSISGVVSASDTGVYATPTVNLFFTFFFITHAFGIVYFSSVLLYAFGQLLEADADSFLLVNSVGYFIRTLP
jgi:hypothetical protein